MELTEIKNQAAHGLRLLIVDHHTLCCTGLAMMFRAVAEVAEVAVATTSEQTIRIAKLFTPDVVILDAAMPSYRGFETARLLLASSSPCRILFLDDEVNLAHIRSALRVGASGYWTKHATFDEIFAAVREISLGRTTFCPDADQHLVQT